MNVRRTEPRESTQRVVDLHNGGTFVMEAATAEAWYCAFGDGHDDAEASWSLVTIDDLAAIQDAIATETGAQE